MEFPLAPLITVTALIMERLQLQTTINRCSSVIITSPGHQTLVYSPSDESFLILPLREVLQQVFHFCGVLNWVMWCNQCHILCYQVIHWVVTGASASISVKLCDSHGFLSQLSPIWQKVTTKWPHQSTIFIQCPDNGAIHDVGPLTYMFWW